MNFASRTIPSSRRVSKFALGWLLPGLLGLCACQPLAATPVPTPQVIRLSFTPAAASWSQRVGACALKLPGVGLVVDEIPTGQTISPQVDVSLRAGLAPSPSLPYTIILGWDEIAILVNASNPLAAISLKDLVALYQGQLTTWDSLFKNEGQAASYAAPLEVWSYPQDDDLQHIFNQEAGLALPQGDLARSVVFTAPDPPALIQAVGQAPGAVGFTLKSYLLGSHPAVRSIPLASGDPGVLRVPVTASLRSEPQGLLRQLVLCGQSSPLP